MSNFGTTPVLGIKTPDFTSNLEYNKICFNSNGVGINVHIPLNGY